MDVIAAFASFAALPVAWIIAERRRTPSHATKEASAPHACERERHGFLRRITP